MQQLLPISSSRSSWDVYGPKREAARALAKEAEDHLLLRKNRIKKRTEEVLAANAPDPILGSKEYQVKHAAILASRRLKEGYRFRKRKNKLSSEINLMYQERLLELEKNPELRLEDEFQHINHLYSDLAAPLDSAMILQNSNGTRTLEAGALGPRYVQLDELLDESKEPDGRSRFIYADFTHVCAKKIARLFIENLSIRRHAVSIIEKYYQFYRARCRWKEMMKERHAAARVLQRSYRYKLEYVRKKKAKDKKNARGLLMIQAAWRRKIARNKVIRIMNSNNMYRMMKLRMWVRKHIHYRRYHRRKVKREYNHARKIQAFIRGCLWRKKLRYMNKCKMIVVKLWRKFWVRVYVPAGKKIIRAYRNMWLHKKVKKLQNFVRRFLARKMVKKQRMRLVVNGNRRRFDEMKYIQALIYNLCLGSSKYFYKTIGGKLSNGENRSFMNEIREIQGLVRYEMQKLNSKPNSANSDDSNSYEHDESTYMNFETGLTNAIFCAFASPDTNYIDSLAVDVMIKYSFLQYKATHQPEISISTRINDKKGNATGKFTLNEYRPYSRQEIIETMQPTRATKYRMFITGKLPDAVFILGRLCSRWSNNALNGLLIEHRESKPFDKPYRYCPCCLQSFNVEHEFDDHIIQYEHGHHHTIHTTFNERIRDLVADDFVCPSKNTQMWLSVKHVFQHLRDRLFIECERNKNLRCPHSTSDELDAAYKSFVVRRTEEKTKRVAAAVEAREECHRLQNERMEALLEKARLKTEMAMKKRDKYMESKEKLLRNSSDEDTDTNANVNELEEESAQEAWEEEEGEDVNVKENGALPTAVEEREQYSTNNVPTSGYEEHIESYNTTFHPNNDMS